MNSMGDDALGQGDKENTTVGGDEDGKGTKTTSWVTLDIQDGFTLFKGEGHDLDGLRCHRSRVRATSNGIQGLSGVTMNCTTIIIGHSNQELLLLCSEEFEMSDPRKINPCPASGFSKLLTLLSLFKLLTSLVDPTNEDVRGGSNDIETSGGMDSQE